MGVLQLTLAVDYFVIACEIGLGIGALTAAIQKRYWVTLLCLAVAAAGIPLVGAIYDLGVAIGTTPARPG